MPGEAHATLTLKVLGDYRFATKIMAEFTGEEEEPNVEYEFTDTLTVGVPKGLTTFLPIIRVYEYPFNPEYPRGDEVNLWSATPFDISQPTAGVYEIFNSIITVEDDMTIYAADVYAGDE